MKTIIGCLNILTVIGVHTEDMLKFIEFQATYGRSYASIAVHQVKFEVFQQNLIAAEEHNSKKLGFKMGVNQFSDLTT